MDSRVLRRFVATAACLAVGVSGWAAATYGAAADEMPPSSAPRGFFNVWLQRVESPNPQLLDAAPFRAGATYDNSGGTYTVSVRRFDRGCEEQHPGNPTAVAQCPKGFRVVGEELVIDPNENFANGNPAPPIVHPLTMTVTGDPNGYEIQGGNGLHRVNYWIRPGQPGEQNPTPPAPPADNEPPALPTPPSCRGVAVDRARVLAFARAAELSEQQAQEFAADPCDVSFATKLEDVLMADDGTDAAVVAGPAGPATCRIATGKVRLVTTLNRFVREVEMASYQMVSYFCYDGSTVWKKGNRNDPPPDAAIQDIRYTRAGTLYQMEYTGIASEPPTTGWLTWAGNGNDKGAAFTTITTNWQAGLPILKWAIPERTSVTRTLTVFANGTSTLS
jgi:hypothetical protein